MLSVPAARKIILSMPHAEESSHHGHPDFRVNGKIFATLWPAEHVAVVKLSVPDQAIFLDSSPRTFSTNAWSRLGYTNVHLKHVTASHFRSLVASSWRAVAPKRLVAEQDAKKE
jgi:hypothetical protein